MDYRFTKVEVATSAPMLASRIAALYGQLPEDYIAALTGEDTRTRRLSLGEAEYIHGVREGD